jgi:copper chaperone CopZ
VITGVGCYRQDLRTIVVDVPAMKTPRCSKIIQDALGGVDGIIAAQPDLQSQSISVTYDSTKLAIKNVEYVITGVGFTANGNDPKPAIKAKLPEECR